MLPETQSPPLIKSEPLSQDGDDVPLNTVITTPAYQKARSRSREEPITTAPDWSLSETPNALIEKLKEQLRKEQAKNKALGENSTVLKKQLRHLILQTKSHREQSAKAVKTIAGNFNLKSMFIKAEF